MVKNSLLKFQPIKLSIDDMDKSKRNGEEENVCKKNIWYD